jgi:hypothetical protein
MGNEQPTDIIIQGSLLKLFDMILKLVLSFFPVPAFETNSMEPGGSKSCPQELTTGHYPESDESSQHLSNLDFI